MTDKSYDFSALSERGAPYRHFDAGEKVFLEDDAGRCLYFVRSGRVSIITYGTVLETVGPGGVFGEMALIDDGPRSAAALALEATEVIEIDRALFMSVLTETPELALAVMRLMSDRIRRMNKNL